MYLLPLNVFSSHGIRAMIKPSQNYLLDCFILLPESWLPFLNGSDAHPVP